jgi:hypothetical protein
LTCKKKGQVVNNASFSLLELALAVDSADSAKSSGSSQNAASDMQEFIGHFGGDRNLKVDNFFN